MTTEGREQNPLLFAPGKFCHHIFNVLMRSIRESHVLGNFIQINSLNKGNLFFLLMCLRPCFG